MAGRLGPGWCELVYTDTIQAGERGEQYLSGREAAQVASGSAGQVPPLIAAIFEGQKLRQMGKSPPQYHCGCERDARGPSPLLWLSVLTAWLRVALCEAGLQAWHFPTPIPLFCKPA